MPPTLKDIAHRAGVSITTASNALSGSTKWRINRDTVERVTRIAGEMGYRPNAIARSLKSQRTDTVAFYTGYGICDVRDRFLGEIVTGIQHACDYYELDLLLYGNLTKRSDEVIHAKLASGKTDGIIVHAASDNPVAAMLAAGSVPAVGIADVQPVLPSIIADDAAGMKALIDHVWGCGHRKIAFATPEGNYESISRRALAFRDAVLAKGGEPQFTHIPWSNTVSVVESILADSNHPTAVCCWHDDTAYYLLETCRHIGVRIPEDIAIAGFDGLPEGRIPRRELTTVRVPWSDMAFEAAATIVRLRDGAKIERIQTFSVELVVGDTV
jgi:DNA-binding LacI/PurR family transcriptional regulator